MAFVEVVVVVDGGVVDVEGQACRCESGDDVVEAVGVVVCGVGEHVLGCDCLPFDGVVVVVVVGWW